MILKRPRVYLFLALLATVGVFGSIARTSAATSLTVHFDASLVSGGKTLQLDNGAKLGIFPGALQTVADVTWGASEEVKPTAPSKRALLGSWYRLQVAGSSFVAGYQRPMAVAIPFGSSNWIRQVWQYDIPSQTWTPLRTTLSGDKKLGQAPPTTLNGWVVILEDRQQLEGTASYYCINVCSTTAGTMYAATNAYPVGTTVRVRNLLNGKSANVKIVSTWAGTSRHVIDLHLAAFSTLGGTRSQGIIPVNVAVPQPKVLGATTASKVETIPNLPVKMSGNLPFPSITPRPFFVMDQGTGRILAEHQADTVVPIASLTKLMTAAVFLDTKPDLKKVITYTAADQTPYGYLRVAPGETLTVRDLFYSMLVGSANNGATALARSTGLSRADFVARMNQKAAEWGLTQTHFTDVHGLDPANVSTAREMATLTAKVLHEYQPVRYVTVRREYVFTTINTGVTHTLKTTDKILGSGLLNSNLIITGGKTGYLGEAKYTYSLRAAHKETGAQVVVVVLRSASSTERFNDTAAIMNWAFRNFAWGG